VKRILVLNGSPRGKEAGSLKLAEAFLEGYLENTKADVERVHLANHRILHCTGCYSCWKSDTGVCVHHDDMTKLLELYEVADLILVSTPVYHYGMTAILKGFFERTLPLSLPEMVKTEALYTHPPRRPVNPERAFGVFATCGFPDMDNFRPMSVHFDKLLGERLKFAFFSTEGELLKVPQLHQATTKRFTTLKKAGAIFAKTNAVPEHAEAAIAVPMVDVPTFVSLANASWGQSSSNSKQASPAETLLTQMAALYNPRVLQGLEACIQFDFTDSGESYQLHLAKNACNLVKTPVKKATTTIIVPFAVWQHITDGSLGGEEALMKGAYRVEGDFTLMMRMNELFRPQSQTANNDNPVPHKRRNLMALAFVPWYFGWFLGGSSVWLGQVVPLVVAIAFLVYREKRHEATWFERGTPMVFSCLTVLSLIAPAFFRSYWSALCNLGIATIWSLSLMYNRPLSAEYSKTAYTETVASGPIFLKINLWLTTLWSALFTLEAAVGFIPTGIRQGTIALVSSLLLIPAGLFTAWFPTWYPEHLAKRGTRT